MDGRKPCSIMNTLIRSVERGLPCTAIALALLLAGCQTCFDRVPLERRYIPESCNDDCDPVLGTCHQCSTCCDGAHGFTPAMYLKHMKTCAAGCGEIYWNEWFNDPPYECDPCDNCGDWIGARCCPPRPRDIFRSGLLGQRSCTACGSLGCSGSCEVETASYELPGHGTGRHSSTGPAATGHSGMHSDGTPLTRPRDVPTPATRPDNSESDDKPQEESPDSMSPDSEENDQRERVDTERSVHSHPSVRRVPKPNNVQRPSKSIAVFPASTRYRQ